MYAHMPYSKYNPVDGKSIQIDHILGRGSRNSLYEKEAAAGPT